MVLAVTPRPRFSALALEVDRGGVEEDQPELGEQVAAAGEERLLDEVLGAAGSAQPPLANLFAQPPHGSVEMLEGQVLGPRDMIVFLPSFGGPVAARSKEPVGAPSNRLPVLS